jgi:aldose sugar dehydrogenase
MNTTVRIPKIGSINFRAAPKAIMLAALTLSGITHAQTPPSPDPPAAPPGAPKFVVRGERAPDTPPREGEVLETRPPYNIKEKPAFAGQTRALAHHTKTDLDVRVVAHGLSQPWGLAFLSNGHVLVTEKTGGMRIVTAAGAIGPSLLGVPKVFFRIDAGMLDVVVDPDFARNRTIYFSYVEPRGELNGMSVARARVSADETNLEDVHTLISLPSYSNALHYGGRLFIAPDHTLYIGSGERSAPEMRIQAQSLNTTLGKILRINLDGSIPTDNPFVRTRGAEPSIYSYGHRIAQGFSINPETKQLWETEHGEQGGDEVNVLLPGHNYGWPLAAYGLEYTDELIDGGRTDWPGTEQPTYYWDPTIAPSGATFYSGSLLPEWRGDFFVAALAGQHLAHLVIRHGKVVGEERLLQEQHQRIRDVVQGPDEALWVITDNPDGRLIRIGPKPR